MATAVSKSVKEVVFEWEGKDRNGNNQSFSFYSY